MKILFLGEPKSANTMSWVDGLRRHGCEVAIASARVADEGRDVFPLRNPSLPPRMRLLLGGGDLRLLIARLQPDLLLAYRVTSYGYLAAGSGFHPLVIAAQNEQITFMPKPFPLQKMVLGHFARRAIRDADLLHAWGPNIRDGLVRFGADEDRILLLHRGIDLSVFHPLDAPPPFDPERPVFVSTRSLTQEYLIDQLIHGFRKLVDMIPGASLVIIGGGPERERLERLSAELRLAGSVLFKGVLQRESLADELRKANFYVSIIPTEGVSSSLLEACACGIVPLVFDMQASRDVIQDQVNGVLVKDASPAALAETMSAAVGRPELRRVAYERNPAAMRSRFDAEANLRVFVDRYKALVKTM